MVFVCKNSGCSNYEIPFASGYGGDTIIANNIPMTKSLYEYLAKLTNKEWKTRTVQSSIQADTGNSSESESEEERHTGRTVCLPIASHGGTSLRVAELPSEGLLIESAEGASQSRKGENVPFEKMIKQEKRKLRMIVAQKERESRRVSTSSTGPNVYETVEISSARTKRGAYLEACLSKLQILALAWRQGLKSRAELSCYGVEWGLDECDKCQFTDKCRERTFENEKHCTYYKQ